MFFILSKTIAFLLLPSNFLFAIALIGLALLLTRWRRAGVMLMAISLVLMALGGFLPVGRILNHTLESRFPPWDPSRGAPDGIIVLGGAISPALVARLRRARSSAEAPNASPSLPSWRATIPRPASSIPAATPACSGTPVARRIISIRCSTVSALPRERVLLEARSRNTVENATFTKELVKPKPGERWLLVTSA